MLRVVPVEESYPFESLTRMSHYCAAVPSIESCFTLATDLDIKDKPKSAQPAFERTTHTTQWYVPDLGSNSAIRLGVCFIAAFTTSS